MAGGRIFPSLVIGGFLFCCPHQLAVSASFATTTTHRYRGVVNHHAAFSPASTTTCGKPGAWKTPTSTALQSNVAAGAIDFTAEAVMYFNSIRIPAALVTGSSLSALFVFAELLKSNRPDQRSRIENYAISLYHILSLLSLLLSINVIVTATATGNALLLREAVMEKRGLLSSVAITSPYAYLQREFEFEFLQCRWCFYSSLLSFLGSILLRVIISFRLLERTKLRRKELLVVMLSFSSLALHFIGLINGSLQSYSDSSNFGGMTIHLIRMYAKRALWGAWRNPFQFASLITFLVAAVLCISSVREIVRASYDAIIDTSTHDDDKTTGEIQK